MTYIIYKLLVLYLPTSIANVDVNVFTSRYTLAASISDTGCCLKGLATGIFSCTGLRSQLEI